MATYFGRPVGVEPGQNGLTVREAVELMRRHAPDDGWFLRVTGPINTMPNTLIPSTVDAVTHQNYRRRSARARLADQSCTDSRTKERKSGAKLFSAEIASGVVTWPTWLMIQCLPQVARADFEDLVVESIVMYPNRLIAADGREYDRLVAKLQSDRVPWRQELDLGDLTVRQVEDLDHEFVALRFPVGEVAHRLAELRAQAKEKYGKGSGAELTLKLAANTLFGVISSQHQPANNVVAANFITAHARAEAFGMMMCLNALQVVTDGCW